MQRIPHLSIHTNPCNNKILYPILKRSCSKEHRPRSQPMHVKKSDNKAQSKIVRADSCQKGSSSKSKMTKEKEISSIKKKRNESELSFLHKVYEHVSIQNNCLIQQILVKDQKLDSLKLQMRELERCREEVVEQGGIKYWHRQPSSQHASSSNSSQSKFGRMEVILSAESEDECSLADNMEAITPGKPAIVQIFEEEKQKQKQKQQSFRKQSSFQRVGSTKNLVNENDKGDSMNCSKLDQLRKRKGLAVRKSVVEPVQLDK